MQISKSANIFVFIRKWYVEDLTLKYLLKVCSQTFRNNRVCSKHGTIIRTGITCKKVPCYMRDSACRWLIVNNVKIFKSFVKYFWTCPRERNCIILIGLCKWAFVNHLIIFLERHKKTKLMPTSFSYFLELLWPL